MGWETPSIPWLTIGAVLAIVFPYGVMFALLVHRHRRRIIMSYCRFSSDNWKSDLYIYASAAGFETHVATRRHTGHIPQVIWDGSEEALAQSHQAQMQAVSDGELVPIGGPYDGQSFVDETVEELLDRLLVLAEAGYHFPESVVDRLEKEL